jgi:hypothetical protein
LPDKNEWKSKASCLNYDVNIFFDRYEEVEASRKAVEKICSDCPVAKICFATGISQKEYGIWGGVYLEKGKVSREFSRHRAKADWAETWKNLTTDK